jgi:cytosine/adenosine deaminase-related metal-dependent hydrolase
MVTAYRAARIVTMDPACTEVMDGAILIEDGRIAAVVPWREAAGTACRDLGPVTVVPGLINAHAHLELSHLAGRVPGGRGFPAWADALFAAMRTHRAAPSDLAAALAAAHASGTSFVADIVWREALSVREALAARDMGGHLFREMSGARALPEMSPGDWPAPWSVAVHALYSTAPALAREAKAWCGSRGLPFSLHLAEVQGENELLLGRGGDFADFVRSRRILPRGFVPPGMGAVAYAADLGLLDERTLAVHCVHVDDADMGILAQSGASVCLCPRSNRRIGVGEAPAGALHAAGVRLCLGTDSLASNDDLDLWAELRAVRGMLPAETTLRDLLAMVTSNPARILGIEGEYGSLVAGKRAAWAVLPPDFEGCP